MAAIDALASVGQCRSLAPLRSHLQQQAALRHRFHASGQANECSQNCLAIVLATCITAQLIARAHGSRSAATVLPRIDTPMEVDYYRAGGILPFVLQQLLLG